jgi:hypothetical protein
MGKTIEKETLDLETIGDAAFDAMEQQVVDVLKRKPGSDPRAGAGANQYKAYLRGESDLDAVASVINWELRREADEDDGLTRVALESVVEKTGADGAILCEDCPACLHPDVASLDKELIGNPNSKEPVSYWQLSNRYGLTDREIMAHRNEHLLPDLYAHIDAQQRERGATKATA